MLRFRFLVRMLFAVAAMQFAVGPVEAAAVCGSPVSVSSQCHCPGSVGSTPICVGTCATLCCAIAPQSAALVPPAIAPLIVATGALPFMVAGLRGPEPPPPRVAPVKP
jgi:hypothetical protein